MAKSLLIIHSAKVITDTIFTKHFPSKWKCLKAILAHIRLPSLEKWISHSGLKALSNGCKRQHAAYRSILYSVSLSVADHVWQIAIRWFPAWSLVCISCLLIQAISYPSLTISPTIPRKTTVIHACACECEWKSYSLFPAFLQSAPSCRHLRLSMTHNEHPVIRFRYVVLDNTQFKPTVQPSCPQCSLKCIGQNSNLII